MRPSASPESVTYKEALEASKSYQSSEPIGFCAQELSQQGDKINVRQNNVILELLVRLHQKIDHMQEEISLLLDMTKISNSTPNGIDELIKKFDNLKTIGPMPKDYEPYTFSMARRKL